MIEIKFRGKSLADGSWVYGDLCTQDKEYSALIGVWQKETNPYCKWIPVDEDTVGQFTGLRDMNNVEMYKGDKCLKHHDKNLFPDRTPDSGIIEWVDFGARYTLRIPYLDGKHNHYCELYENLDQPQYPRSLFEVIGNIYENL
jgi:uncharacterized phage protein (TIGR01671 family)